VVSFGPVPIAPTPVLDRLRLDLPLHATDAPSARVTILPYVSYFQRRPFWCWAAVAMSIDRYYDRDSTVTQCQIAGRVLRRSDCCSADKLGGCDRQTSLRKALRAVNRYHGSHRADSGLACRLLDRGQPVGIFIQWTRTTGHFAALCGYTVSTSGLEFVVADPRYGERPVLDSELRGGLYRGTGTWTRLYRTAE
jgi:hypothetical protein